MDVMNSLNNVDEDMIARKKALDFIFKDQCHFFSRWDVPETRPCTFKVVSDDIENTSGTENTHTTFFIQQELDRILAELYDNKLLELFEILEAESNFKESKTCIKLLMKEKNVARRSELIKGVNERKRQRT
ncbi:hypothetical protein E3N88_28236 [Mikania micrantha]|uniref:Uncharacterized protein n=1 Tax=Mikania micrantha TaxID=192012 RepID=A0A5N6N1S2_9ASTR|nr:hypothetical protein E3N88_28236 [Mikania micrantha]